MPPGVSGRLARWWCILVLLAPASLAAQELSNGTGGAECCIGLLTPVGARAGALRGAITARRGPDMVFRNPAGLADLGGRRFVIHHSDNKTLDIQVDAFSLLLTPFSTTIGLSYELFDLGTIETTDATGQTTGELTYRNHLVVASFAVQLGAGLSAGVNYKLYQERVGCTGLCAGEENVATTQAADFGLRWSPAWHPALEVGVSVVNAGLALQVVNADQADAFPGRLHYGVAYDVLAGVSEDSVVALRLAVDARDQLAEPLAPVMSYGVELDLQRTVFLRAGYTPGEGLGRGAALGLALHYDRFDLGVSRSFINVVGEGTEEPFQISLGLGF